MEKNLPGPDTPGRKQSTSKYIEMMFLIIFALIFSRSPQEPEKKAQRLIGAAESGRLVTPGAWADWIKRVEYLPKRLRSWCWRQLRKITLQETYLNLSELRDRIREERRSRRP